MNIPAILAIVGASQGIPNGLLSALCYVESSHNPYIARIDSNNHISIGLCQIQPRAATEVGFKHDTFELLLDPKINAKYAAKYLKKQYRRYGNWDQAVIAYNRGNAKGVTTTKYLRKVKEAWAAKR